MLLGKSKAKAPMPRPPSTCPKIIFHGTSISRILYPGEPGLTSIPLGQNSRFGSSCLPGSGVGTPLLPYLALHRIRHSWLPLSPMAPVVSYTTISPLRGTRRYHAVCFCGAGSALLQLPVRKYPAQGVRTFLCADGHSRHLSFPWKKLF